MPVGKNLLHFQRIFFRSNPFLLRRNMAKIYSCWFPLLLSHSSTCYYNYPFVLNAFYATHINFLLFATFFVFFHSVFSFCSILYPFLVLHFGIIKKILLTKVLKFKKIVGILNPIKYAAQGTSVHNNFLGFLFFESLSKFNFF